MIMINYMTLNINETWIMKIMKTCHIDNTNGIRELFFQCFLLEGKL